MPSELIGRTIVLQWRLVRLRGGHLCVHCHAYHGHAAEEIIVTKRVGYSSRASVARKVDNVVRGLKVVNGRNSTCFMAASTSSQVSTAGPDGSGHGRKPGLKTNTIGTGMLMMFIVVVIITIIIIIVRSHLYLGTSCEVIAMALCCRSMRPASVTFPIFCGSSAEPGDRRSLDIVRLPKTSITKIERSLSATGQEGEGESAATGQAFGATLSLPGV